MLGAAKRSWRTWAYVVLTYVGAARLSRMSVNPLGRMGLRAAQRLVRGGWIRVGGGLGFGLRLSTDHLPITHRQGFGLVRGVLEPSVQEAMRRHAGPGAVVYDVGANIGFFSLLAARLAGPEGRVEAFEPVPESAAAVRANASLNGFGTVHVHPVAVGDRAAPDRLLVHREKSESHLADRGNHPEIVGELAVDVLCLDDEIERGVLPVPDLVKIDVEGSEIAVLKGIERTLRSHPVVVVCELHETNRELAEFLGSLGYGLENLDGTIAIEDAGPVHVLARASTARETKCRSR